jgi:hypothetical protein
MIPIRDMVGSRTVPVVNYAFIGLNVLAYLWQVAQGPRLEEVFFLYGIVPQRYSDPALAARFSDLQQALPFLTSMFLHGGLMHILGNMWFLYVFGDNVEDTLGHGRYLLFYLLSGLAAGVAHLLINWGSRIPTIGASGAISGVMGAYLLLHPRARILTLIPIVFFFQFVEVPAFIFLGLWLLMQFFSASLTRGDVGGVAWWAHIGGFAAGMVVLKLLQLIPRSALGSGMRRRTERRATPRLQTVAPWRLSDALDIQATIAITPREARHGTRKIVSVPQGLRRKTVLVRVPPGLDEGMRLRLAGMGNVDSTGRRGDLYLEVRIRDWES